jgi:tetratricopeptide (TPR) repeat protein
MIISMFLFLPITLFVLDAYSQQQGGSANSGSTTGGAVTAGGITGFNCDQCSSLTINNSPQATGGETSSGAATGGAATSDEATSISTLVDKGNALYNQSNYAEAIQYYDKALTIDPNNQYVLYNEGQAHYSQGDYDQALQYINRALAIDPNNYSFVEVKASILLQITLSGNKDTNSFPDQTASPNNYALADKD